MNTNELKILSEEDFDLIVKALEALPNAKDSGLILGTIMGSILSNEGNKGEIEDHLKKREGELDKEKQRVTEEVRILQGKILTMKRAMIANDLLAGAKDILKN